MGHVQDHAQEAAVDASGRSVTLRMNVPVQAVQQDPVAFRAAVLAITEQRRLRQAEGGSPIRWVGEVCHARAMEKRLSWPGRRRYAEPDREYLKMGIERNGDCRSAG